MHPSVATVPRQGEVFGLTANRVDFLRGLVKVDRQAVALATEPIRLGPPERPPPYRESPMPRDGIEAILAHIAVYELGARGVIFHAEDGRFMRRSTFSAMVGVPARKAADLPSDIGIRVLRHYYASRPIRFGESVKTVQNRLGHASASKTLDTYSHADDQTREAVADLLSEPVAASWHRLERIPPDPSGYWRRVGL